MNIIDLKIRKLGKNRKFGQRLREEERRKTSTRAFATRAKNERDKEDKDKLARVARQGR